MCAALAAACAPPDDTPTDTDSTTDVPRDTAPLPSTSFTVHPAPGCADPTARTQLGPLAPPLVGGDWAAQPFDPTPREMFAGGGLTIADLDGDGHLDILLPGVGASQLFLQTTTGTFVDASERLPQGATRATAATAGDYDGDGDLDLFVGRYDEPDQLWRNDAGWFTDVTAATGLTDVDPGRTGGASWADPDRDGDLDLFVAGHGGLRGVDRTPGDPSRLLRNRGDGTFEDVSDLLPARVHDGYTFIGGWHDLDDNGWPDLYLVNDFGNVWPNVVMWNQAGTLSMDDARGLDAGIQGMGLGVGDLNGDGVVDVAVAGWGNNRLLVSDQDAWFDAHRAAGLQGDRARDQVVGWSMELGDLDNDGDLDVIEGFGHIWNQQTPPDEPDEIFLNEGTTLRPVGTAWRFDHPGQTRAVLAVDLNQDGWLDLVRRDLSGPATIQLARCGDAAWTRISLVGDAPNGHAIGAQVRVTAGEHTYTRTLDAGSTSLLASRPPVAHIGLGQAEAIDHIDVRWPDGTTTRYGPAPVRHPLTLERRSP